MGKLVELLLGCLELNLELPGVNAFCLGDEEPSTKQLELLHQLLVSTAQIVALTEDASELLIGRGELDMSRRKLDTHAHHQSFELFDASLRQLNFSDAHVTHASIALS